MPWIGIAEGVPEERAKAALERLGLSAKRLIGLVDIKTSRGWVRFRVYEVEGGVEGVAEVLAPQVGAPAFESGRHLILGEASAKLWDEGAKVAFPDGFSEVVPIFTFDGFLDVRMPTSNVRGLKASIVVGGRVYELPLGLRELLEIYEEGKGAVEKVEKAASVYGLEKVVSREALEELRRLRTRVRFEVDYEAGFALVLEGSKVRTVPLKKFFLDLIYEGKLEEARRVYEGAPEHVRSELREALREERDVLRELGLSGRFKALEDAAKAFGID